MRLQPAVAIDPLAREGQLDRLAKHEGAQRLGCGRFHGPLPWLHSDVEGAGRQSSNQPQLRCRRRGDGLAVDNASHSAWRARLEPGARYCFLARAAAPTAAHSIAPAAAARSADPGSCLHTRVADNRGMGKFMRRVEGRRKLSGHRRPQRGHRSAHECRAQKAKRHRPRVARTGALKHAKKGSRCFLCFSAFCVTLWQTWQRPTLPRLKTKYHRRWGVSRPSSEWDRVQPPRNNHQVGKRVTQLVFEAPSAPTRRILTAHHAAPRTIGLRACARTSAE